MLRVQSPCINALLMPKNNKRSSLIPSTSRHNVGEEVSGGGQRGGAGIEILSHVASCELLGDYSASDLVTLFDENHLVPTIFPSGSLRACSRVTWSHTCIWDMNPMSSSHPA